MVIPAKQTASIVTGAPKPSVSPREAASAETSAEWALGMPPVLTR